MPGLLDSLPLLTNRLPESAAFIDYLTTARGPGHQSPPQLWEQRRRFTACVKTARGR